MNRRDLLKAIIPATALMAGVPSGAAVVQRDKKCVLVCDHARISREAASAIGVSLGLPKETRIIFVHCAEDQTPESAFSLLEVSE